jgi:hypothetical protein
VTGIVVRNPEKMKGGDLGRGVHSFFLPFPLLLGNLYWDDLGMNLSCTGR